MLANNNRLGFMDKISEIVEQVSQQLLASEYTIKSSLR